jgi:hypothetical protein
MPRGPNADMPIKGKTLRGASMTHTPKIKVIPATTSFAMNIRLSHLLYRILQADIAHI